VCQGVISFTCRTLSEINLLAHLRELFHQPNRDGDDKAILTHCCHQLFKQRARVDNGRGRFTPDFQVNVDVANIYEPIDQKSLSDPVETGAAGPLH
jgi:hypothetical protein